MIYCIAFSPDGRLLASTGDHSAIKLWDTATGKEVRTLAGHQGMPDAFAFSPDGRWLASTSSRDIGVTLWEVATGQAVRTFEEHGQYENPHYAGEIAFTPDGDWLVWSDLSGTCYVVGSRHGAQGGQDRGIGPARAVQSVSARMESGWLEKLIQSSTFGSGRINAVADVPRRTIFGAGRRSTGHDDCPAG